MKITNVVFALSFVMSTCMSCAEAGPCGIYDFYWFFALQNAISGERFWANTMKFTTVGASTSYQGQNCMMRIPVTVEYNNQNYVNNVWTVLAERTGTFGQPDWSKRHCWEVILTAGGSDPLPNAWPTLSFMNQIADYNLFRVFNNIDYRNHDPTDAHSYNPYYCISHENQRHLRGMVETNSTYAIDTGDFLMDLEGESAAQFLEPLEEGRSEEDKKANGPLADMDVEELEKWMRMQNH